MLHNYRGRAKFVAGNLILGFVQRDFENAVRTVEYGVLPSGVDKTSYLCYINLSKSLHKRRQCRAFPALTRFLEGVMGFGQVFCALLKSLWAALAVIVLAGYVTIVAISVLLTSAIGMFVITSLGGHASYGMCVLASVSTHVVIIAGYFFWDMLCSEE